MKHSGKWPVAVIVAAALAAVATVLLATFGTVSYVSEERREMRRLRSELNAAADQLSDGLALPAWNIDRTQIDKIIAGMNGSPAIYGVVVTAAGKTHACVRDSQWRLVPTDGPFPAQGLLVAERAIRFSGESIGTIRLFATPRFVESRLRQFLLAIVGAIVAMNLLLIACVYLVLWPSVLRPLMEIEKYALAVSTAAEIVDVPIATGPSSEIENVRSSIQTMVHLLEARYTELREHVIQRQRMEDQLKAEKDFTDLAINAMKEIFFVRDREGRYFRWNRAMEVMAGTQDVNEKRALDRIYPADRDRVAHAVEGVFERGYGEVEARVNVKDEVRYYSLSGTRMTIEGEQFLVGTGFDITDRRNAEAAQRRLQKEIERSALEWKQTFDTVTTPIFVTERDGCIVRVNRAAEDLTGRSYKELSSGLIQDISAGEPWQMCAQLVSHLADEGTGTSAETKDALGRTWDVTISRFDSIEDGAERFILVLWEITSIVELQESLRRSETMSAMGTLVAGVAHEVRNPLFGISATLDAYAEEMSQPGYVEFAATLRREVNRLIHLMKELLEYGKPPALSIALESVGEVVREAVESRQPSARAARIEIRNLVGREIPPLLMDRSRLRQVFENLIDNAIQHSRESGVVRITDSLVDQAGRQWVECSVEDDGPGFDHEDLDRVFEPFFTQREGGTGLGLSIVQRIVEEHSGKVSAGNRPEGGGVVRVLFPLSESGVSNKVI